jgi:hypothetical protein
MMEYAYFDGFFKGNSKEMVESLAKLKKFFDANVLMEFALQLKASPFKTDGRKGL